MDQSKTWGKRYSVFYLSWPRWLRSVGMPVLLAISLVLVKYSTTILGIAILLLGLLVLYTFEKAHTFIESNEVECSLELLHS